MRPRTVYSLLQAILALIGAGIAGFLYREHEAGLTIPCFAGSGCETVSMSHWAYVFGQPVSLIGAIAYMAILFAAVFKVTTDSDKVCIGLAWILLVLTAGGFAASWGYQYIAKYLIEAFCIWCRASAITMTLLFIVSIGDVIVLGKSSRIALSTADAQKITL